MLSLRTVKESILLRSPLTFRMTKKASPGRVRRKRVPVVVEHDILDEDVLRPSRHRMDRSGH